MKKMTGKERQDKRMGPLRDSDNNLVLDDSKKAETLSNFFSTIGKKLALNFETYTHDNSPSDILAMNKCEIANNITISEEKFKEKFKKLKIRKSHGAHEITAREMKIVGDEVSYGFASITRSGIAEGKYPGQLKTGKVKTIFKKGKKDLCDNYRPLTMLDSSIDTMVNLIDLIDQPQGVHKIKTTLFSISLPKLRELQSLALESTNYDYESAEYRVTAIILDTAHYRLFRPVRSDQNTDAKTHQT